MANLIITIISIAIIGIAAAMAVFYGGTAFENAQFSAIAAAIISESNQILTAQRVYAINHGQADATGVDFSMLVTDGELSTYPPIGGGQLGVNLGTSWGSESYGLRACYNYNGYHGMIIRVPFTYHSGNYVVYQFWDDDPYVLPCNGTGSGNYASNPKNSIMLMAQAINQQLGLPQGVTLFEGLPINMTSNYTDSSAWSVAQGVGSLVLDNNGNPMTNMCYYNGTFPPFDISMTCVFGPS